MKKRLFHKILLFIGTSAMIFSCVFSSACNKIEANDVPIVTPPGGSTETPGGSTETPGGSTETPGDTPIVTPPGDTSSYALKSEYVNPSVMPYYAEWLDKDYPRQKNVTVKNEGLAEYPVFGSVFKSQNSQARTDIYNENLKLISADTSLYGGSLSNPLYNMMDKDGNLLKINFGNAQSPADATDSGMDLYKHTAAAGMYCGNVSDSEPAVVKRIVLNGKGYGTVMTGLYAPAGEVVKVQMPASSLRDRNIYISVGQIMGSGRALVMPANASKFIRMPIISNRFRMNRQSSYYDEATDTYSFYIGSHLGGPIYLLPNNAASKSDTSEFEFTISGAVNYRHYIHGVTTKEEFEYTAQSSAPYFDMEVRWMEGVRHSGPLKFASSYSFEQLERAAALWENFGYVSNQVPNWCPGKGNIVYVYDDYVMRGAACAVMGNYTVNAPYGWLTNALNYEYFVKNGSWGNAHEYNHHYQKFGLSGDSNEITNNAVNLVEYALFTKISAARTLNGGLGGWNAYTMPQYGLKYLVDENIKNRNSRTSLHLYAALLHNLGAEAFLASAKTGSNPAGYYGNLVNGTHLDMTYFFNELLNFADESIGGEAAVAAVKEKNYPMFVPVNTVYQVGKIWEKDGVKQYARTAQPFVYGVGDYTLDFENNFVIPQGFSYRIKSVTQPENGTVAVTDDKHIEYTSNGKKLSGEFLVTVEIKKDDNAFAVNDAVLIINLEQSNILQRTTWSYTEEAKPDITSSDALVDFYNNLKPTDKNAKVGENINPVQNANTEIWGGFSTDPYSIMEVKGELYINSDGKYRIALRGRQYAALYLSYDGGETYTDVIKLTPHTSGADFMPNDYVDVELKAGEWVGFKAVLYNDYQGSFIGVGLGKFGANSDGESSSDSVNIDYISGYKDKSYLEELFVAPPYRSKIMSYIDKVIYDQTLVGSKFAYSVNDNPKYNLKVDYSLDNIFDDDENNVFWCTGNTFGDNSYSEQKPFELTVDLGKVVCANTFTVYYPKEASFAQYYMTKFKLYAGETKENMTLVYSTDEGGTKNNSCVIALDKEINLRYYKLVVTDAYRADDQFAIRKLEWSYSSTGQVVSANAKILDYYEYDLVKAREAVTYSGGWKKQSAECTFGVVNVGNSTAEATFKFTGTRVTLYSLFGSEFGSFDVYLDGKKVETVSLTDGSGVSLAFDSGRLKDGEHVLTVKGNSGSFNIDSFIVY